MRILIYTGKGGVGKSSIAATTALRIASQGQRVLIMSTDQAHSLKDAFDISMKGNLYSIKDGLDLLEINTIEESRKAWGQLQDYLKEIISQKANGGVAAEESLIFPGFEELFALLRILDLYEEGKYDVLVVDCAPTGETLSLLRYPERVSVIADKILPMVKNMNKAFGSLISRKTTVPKPKEAVFDEFEKLIKRLNKLRHILQDRNICSLRLVMTPERIVIDEARRSYTWIQLYDFGVDAIYVNRIYPERSLKGYFGDWAKMQEESLSLVKESFPQQKHFYLEMQEEEIRGLERLEKVSDTLYGEDESIDPSQIFCLEEAIRMEDEDGTRIFILHLPYAKEEELYVEKDGKEILIVFRNERRRFRLPDKLVRRYISKWEYRDKELRIHMDYD